MDSSSSSPHHYLPLLSSPLSSSSFTTRTIYSDRFIPSRAGSNFALFDLATPRSNGGKEDGSDGGGNAYTLFGAPESPATPDRSSALPAEPPNRNIFRFKAELPRFSLAPPSGLGDALPSGLSGSPTPPKAPRKVPRSPYKVLDAPALQDDFYLNLVDWSPNNVLAVGLGNCAYLWNACSSKVTKLCDLGADDSVCSVGWAQRGSQLAVGTNLGQVQIWDASRCRRIRTMEGHSLRVGALAWSSSLLSSGSRDKTILQRDIRARKILVASSQGTSRKSVD